MKKVLLCIAVMMLVAGFSGCKKDLTESIDRPDISGEEYALLTVCLILSKSKKVMYNITDEISFSGIKVVFIICIVYNIIKSGGDILWMR